jgi:hypothetical protein
VNGRSEAKVRRDVRRKSVAVVVPAYNEEALIASTVSTIPTSSTGSSSSTTPRQMRGREGQGRRLGVDLIVHEQNQGVGAAIVTGYKRAIAEEIEITCVMAADGQMDPRRPRDARPGHRRGEVDYAEGEPALHRPGLGAHPAHPLPRERACSRSDEDRLRLLARGRLAVGYTAVNLETLSCSTSTAIYKRYGFPNDLLVHLNVWNRRVRDYPSGRSTAWASGAASACARSSRDLLAPDEGLLLADEGEVHHPRLPPLVLFYALGMLLFGAGFLLGLARVGLRIAGTRSPARHRPRRAARHLRLQLLLFAMWFDMESNKDLR